MIYLIGGMPRVGKSTLAKMILERKNISWMPLDIVRGALNSMVPNLGIKTGEDWWEGHHEKFFPFIKKLIHRIKQSDMPYVLEGDSFTPIQADTLIKEFGVKVCFLGTSKIDTTILKNLKGVGDDWISDISKEELEKLPGWIIKKSQEYKQECENIGIKYFDVSTDHTQVLEDAYNFLIQSLVSS